MRFFRRRKLVSMLLMTVILAVNVLMAQVVLSIYHTAGIAMDVFQANYQSYSEDITSPESVYDEAPEVPAIEPEDPVTEFVDRETEPDDSGTEPDDPGTEPDDQEPVSENPVEEPSSDNMQDEGIQHVKEEPGEAVRIVFLGDCMMADNMARALDQHGMEYTLADFDALLNQADLIIANLETSIGTSRILMDKSFPFQSDPAYLSIFEPYRDKIVFTLANNHGMDAPLAETMNALDDLNYTYIGVGKNKQQAYAPHVIEINGISFAIFGASQVMPTSDWRADNDKPGMAEAYNTDKLISYIAPWLNEVDYTIAYIHWGEELAKHPTSNQRKLEGDLREAGVNVVIGSHPHVLQAVEWYGEKQFTAHSLGNFVFTTSHTSVANDTAALEMVINRDRIHEARMHFARIHFGKVHSVVNSSDRERMITRMNELSRSVKVETNGTLSPVNIRRQGEENE